ncbi:unnamed protein product [Brachionus calyciflorus]|uniref:Uncharacterized protein n=1 Tax=Brachionus calyciflorus TaxID=104777 RepID=A0A814B9K8_9BILA|nr:unnamed protein product [Brachionus calyciflorus]
MDKMEWKWAEIDPILFESILIPIIPRHERYFICVRLVINFILNNYENEFSEEAKSFGSLVGSLCTKQEVDLLNEINKTYLNGLSDEEFTENDIMCDFDEFIHFYHIVKKTVKLRQDFRVPVITEP